MYQAARINEKVFVNSEMLLTEGNCEIQIPIRPEYHHAMQALHGSVYFKLLDDSAFFAAQSLEFSHFIVTSTFSIQLLRPVSEGILVARGKVRNRSRNQIVAESALFDQRGREIAFGTGNFMKSALKLSQADGYDANAG